MSATMIATSPPRRHAMPLARARERLDRTVLVVDDHHSFAELLQASLSEVPGLRCVGTASSTEDALREVARTRPDVVVMDIELPGGDGLAATRRIRSLYPQTVVVILTSHADGAWVARAASAGASAYVAKGGSLTELVEVLRTSALGPMRCAPSLHATAPAGRCPGPELTRRELEVLGFIGQGMPTKTMAAVMGISLHTCRGHIKIVYSKLHVSSRIGALNEARELHLLS